MNSFKEYLEIGANFSAIATAIVAVWFWYRLKSGLRKRTSALETYLRQVRSKDMKTGHQGACSVAAISRYTGLNESQIWESYQNSANLEILARLEEDSIGEVILFRYKHSN
jgi:hypothetical protein